MGFGVRVRVTLGVSTARYVALAAIAVGCAREPVSYSRWNSDLQAAIAGADRLVVQNAFERGNDEPRGRTTA